MIKTENIIHKTPLPQPMVQRLVMYLVLEDTEVLPNSRDIEDYPNGLDGMTYVFEIAGCPSRYRIYSYWEPENDHYVSEEWPEIKHVRSILKAINQEVDLWTHFSNFLDRLPIGRYRYGGINIEKF